MNIAGYFLFGVIVGVITTIVFLLEKNKYENREDDPEMDSEFKYYVKVLGKGNELIRIAIEEPLDLNHRITLDDITYIVIQVDHNENNHTIFTLKKV